MTEISGEPYSLSIVAETGERLADLAPYVAAIDDRGSVVFHDALAAGGSGVFRGDGAAITIVARPREWTAADPSRRAALTYQRQPPWEIR